ncbi:MAG: tRNA (adenosine(37)-N6)-threonylcarbamoyltransferase complex ATPase subunit type 1 TsaE [Acidimicrobiales bacterium]
MSEVSEVSAVSAEPARLARFSVSSPKATTELGRQLARCLVPGDVLLVEGDLGAGKTTFVQGLAAGLGVTGPVTSPTFTLMRVLECQADRPVRRLLHADLYRLDHLSEVLDLGLLELVDDGAVAAVEWGDAGAPVLGETVLEVRIERPEQTEQTEPAEPTESPGGEQDRIITILGTGTWKRRARELAGAMATSA